MLLLEQAGTHGDRVLLAHALLAPLSPELLWHLEEDQRSDVDALRPVLAELARRVSG